MEREVGSEEREEKKRDGKKGSKVPRAYTVGGGEKYLVIEW